jgi:ribosomal protein S6--L-glutamate ligase
VRVCLIADRPDHPVLGEAMAILAGRHEQRVALAASLASGPARRRELDRPADVYLLKSRSPAALELGTQLADRGAIVINHPSATALCLDRAAMADRLQAAGLPQPSTTAFTRLADVPAGGNGLRFPVMVKSRHSRRGDLVAKLSRPADVLPLAREWEDEPVVLQEFTPGSGYDLKLWAIGDDLHAARRRSPLETGATGAAKRNLPLEGGIAEQLEDIGRAVGHAFSLHLYGVDVIMSPDGPTIVDVNAFPGFRGVDGAPERLAALVERSATRFHTA